MFGGCQYLDRGIVAEVPRRLQLAAGQGKTSVEGALGCRKYPKAGQGGTCSAKPSLGRQGRISLEAIAGRLAESRFGRSHGHGNGLGLSECHEESHLLIGDMAARHERSPHYGKTVF